MGRIFLGKGSQSCRGQLLECLQPHGCNGWAEGGKVKAKHGEDLRRWAEWGSACVMELEGRLSQTLRGQPGRPG